MPIEKRNEFFVILARFIAGIEQESEIRAVTAASHELPSQGSLESLDSEPEFATTDVSTAATVPQVSTVPAITVTPAAVASAVTEIHDDTAEQNVPVVQGSLEQEETVPVAEEETDEKGKSRLVAFIINKS